MDQEKLSSTDLAMLNDKEDIWRKAIDHVLVCNCLGTTDGIENVYDALKMLGELVSWEVGVATDPRVNGGYELVKIEREEPDFDIFEESHEEASIKRHGFVMQKDGKNIPFKGEWDDYDPSCENDRGDIDEW